MKNEKKYAKVKSICKRKNNLTTLDAYVKKRAYQLSLI